MAVDPEILARAHLRSNIGEFVEGDRSCPNCGYSLKGLRVGGRCPECGQLIAERARRSGILDDSLVDAPMGYLRLLALGCFLMMAGSLGTLFLLRFAWQTQNQWLAAGAGVACVAWLSGLYIVTDPRRSDAPQDVDPKLQWRRTRWAVRFLFLAWLGAVIAVFIGIRLQMAGLTSMRAGLGVGAAGFTRHADIAAGILIFIGIAAFIPLSVMLADLAEWAKNFSMAERLRSAAWGLCVGGIVTIICQAAYGRLGPLNFVAVILRSLGAIGFLIGLGLFLISTVQLAVMSLWAIRNAQEHYTVNQRRAERKALELERDMHNAPPPGVQPSAVFESREPVVPTTNFPPPSVRHGIVRERQTEANPYEIAPDEEPGSA